MTRPPLSVVIPCHSPKGASVSQPVLSVQFSPTVASYNADNTARSRSASAVVVAGSGVGSGVGAGVAVGSGVSVGAGSGVAVG